MNPDGKYHVKAIIFYHHFLGFRIFINIHVKLLVKLTTK